MKDSQAFNLLNQFLAINTYDEKKKYDLILVLGNAIAETGLIAYQLYKTGHAYHFMIAGGKGHTTDILINTIPYVVVKENEIDKAHKRLMIVDIASYPYGIDHHYALSKGLNCQILSSIPCKYAYGYAGKMVADEIERELENA